MKDEAKDEPWLPVSIGVDVTSAGAYVVGIYALDKDTSQIFYAKHHPAPQRTWVGLTDKDWKRSKHTEDFKKGVDWAEEMLKARNS